LAFHVSQIRQRGAQHAFVIDAAVLEKPRVFDRQHGVFHDLGNLIDGREGAAFFAKLAQQRAFGRINAQRQLGAVVGQIGNVGQIRIGHGQRHGDNAAQGHSARQGQSAKPQHDAHRPAQPAWAPSRSRCRPSGGILG